MKTAASEKKRTKRRKKTLEAIDEIDAGLMVDGGRVLEWLSR